MKIDLNKIYVSLTAILPVLGVIFLDWNAFEMLFIYLSEGAILSYFGMLKRNRIVKYLISSRQRTKESTEKQGNPIWVFFVFGFFYFFLLGMSVMAKAVSFPKLDFTLLSFGKILIAPLLQNKEILFLIIGTLIGNALMYSNFLRKEEYIDPKDKNPEMIFAKSVMSLFAIICLSFPVFWLVTLIGSLFHLESAKFVNIVMAIVMVFILNIVQIYRALTIKNF